TNVPVSPPSSADTTHAFPVVVSAANDTLHAVWLEVFGTASSRVRYARSSSWGASWTKPATLVGAGTSVYPWVAARGDEVAVTVYHTDTSGTADTVAGKSQSFEGNPESTDGRGSVTARARID